MKTKMIFKVLALLLVTGSFAGCPSSVIIDYSGYSYYVWVNDSDYTITISSSDARLYDPENPSQGKTWFEAELAPGEKCTEIYDMMAGTMPPMVIPKISVEFDDGTNTYSVEFSVEYGREGDVYTSTYLPLDYDSDYHLYVEENYVSENVDSPQGCSECVGHRWTYTFTNADYEAAKSYVQGLSGE